MAAVPDLEYGCGSWIISSKETGESVLETFNKSVAEKVNQEKYTVETAMKYLCRLNEKIKNATN